MRQSRRVMSTTHGQTTDFHSSLIGLVSSTVVLARCDPRALGTAVLDQTNLPPSPPAALSSLTFAFHNSGVRPYIERHHASWQIVVKEHGTGTILLNTKIPLTPGPLVVVIKGSWPPTESTSVETVAASFVPPKNGSAVRLFNL
eukprot:SAG31_NODE_4389_length_3277_cov_7.853682_3_plen_144_part_00